MVFKALAGGASGDLANAADFYGYFADTVLVTDPAAYGIRTYEGNDRIDASRATATGGQNIISGSGNDTIRCNSNSDTVIDGSGNDSLSLGAGNDSWYVGAGNDFADGGAGTADYIFLQYDSNDGLSSFTTNTVGVSLDLAKTTAQNLGVFGIDTFKNFESVVGGEGNDSLRGSDAANELYGLGGNDSLSGRAGNDEMYGGDGRDTLTGGTGADRLFVGEGTLLRDTVKFLSMADSGTTDTLRDQIFDFDAGGTGTDDKIDMKTIDANSAQNGDQAFTFRGAGAFSSAAGEIRLLVSGTDTLVLVDIDSDAGSEMTFWVRGVTGLVAADFVL
jgi:Ca2+-binding RTX toxin-like protein